MKDSAIIDLFFERSDTAVTELEAKYGLKMKSHADRYLSDRRDAEEVYNDTLVAIWSSIPPDHPNKLLTYVLAVLEHKIFDKLKYQASQKRSRTEEALFSDFDDAVNHVGKSASAEEIVINRKSGVINDFLASETESSRRVFVKRYYYGKSISDIARESGMSENAVYARISRTKARLYTYLKEKGVTI